MLDTAQYPARLCAMLGLLPWRLRREVAQEVNAAAAKAKAKAPDVQTSESPTSIARVDASETPAYAPVQQVAAGVRVWAADALTVIHMPKFGCWWLPAISVQAGEARLFRSNAEMDMLQMMLQVVGLEALARHMQAVDAHFATAGAETVRLPPDKEELLSLPGPRVLCGAVAEQHGKVWGGHDAALSLTHPLQLLQQPHTKRTAWQQLLAYRQVIHV